MPTWTPEQLRAYENRRSTSRAQPQPIVRDDTVRPAARKEENTSRVPVCVRSYRSRLIDPDNLCPKYFIDCLRYAGLIRDDASKDIRLTVEQFQVERGDERTEIEITDCAPD